MECKRTSKIACENAGIEVDDHFPDIRKVIEAGKGALQDIADMILFASKFKCKVTREFEVE